jgi:hypothetical protein
VARCEVSGHDVDAVTVEALAYVCLAARRHGCRLEVVAPPALLDLLAFMGLADALAGRGPAGSDR